MNGKIAARIGAVFYILWGIVHIRAAWMVYQSGQSLAAGPIQGRISQEAWNTLAVAIAAIIVAIGMNWRNSKTGFWLNIIMVSAGDIGFVILILVPGYMPWWPGLEGPIAWVIAAFFTALARAGAAKAAGPQQRTPEPVGPRVPHASQPGGSRSEG